MSAKEQSDINDKEHKFEEQKKGSSNENVQDEDILSSQEQQIEELQDEISRKLEEMEHFRQEMKKRRIQQQIDQKEQENPFVVKQTYVDRQLKKINAKSGDLKVINTGEDDQQEMQRKVQEILRKINL